MHRQHFETGTNYVNNYDQGFSFGAFSVNIFNPLISKNLRAIISDAEL